MTTQDIVDLLNAVTDVDPRTMHKLVETRVQINDALARADLPVVATTKKVKGHDAMFIGLLGLLNGLADKEGVLIQAVYDEHRKLAGFRVRKRV